jgi:hypothetical protein
MRRLIAETETALSRPRAFAETAATGTPTGSFLRL